MSQESGRLDFASILYTATRTHAAHLTRFFTTPLLSSPRLALFPLNLPSVVERDEDTTPVSFRIPLPSRQKQSALVVSVSSMTGLVEIEDESANESRASRARLASVEANKPPGRLLDSLVRLITAVSWHIPFGYVALTFRSLLRMWKARCDSLAGRLPVGSHFGRLTSQRTTYTPRRASTSRFPPRQPTTSWRRSVSRA